MKKSDREIMEILEAFDATGVAHSAAPLCNADPKTVRRYAQARDLGRPVSEPVLRPKLIDPFLDKIEEWVERSKGKVRADKVHERLAAMGFAGTERTTRRAVAAAKARWRAGHVRTYRPWITEPGLWLQWDWGKGPQVPGPDGTLRETLLFCAWLAWSRYRVVLPVWDRTLPTLIACLDATLRRVGGAPVYALTDNEKTVTVEHVAGVPVRHPEIVAVGRHYGMTVHTCIPYDPESKGGSESTVKIAKADLVPTEVNLREAYASFAGLAAACEEFCEVVNGRVHRETCAVPAQPAGGRAGPAAPAAGRAAYRRARDDPDGEHRSDDPVRQRALFHPARPGGRGGVGPRGRGGAGRGRGPGGAAAAPGLGRRRAAGPGRGRPASPVGAGEPADRPGPLPRSSAAARRDTAPAAGQAGHGGRGGVPGDRRRRPGLADRGGRRGRLPGPREDGRGSRVARSPARPRWTPRWAPPRWRAGSVTVTCCPSPASRRPGPASRAGRRR